MSWALGLDDRQPPPQAEQQQNSDGGGGGGGVGAMDGWIMASLHRKTERPNDVDQRTDRSDCRKAASFRSLPIPFLRTPAGWLVDEGNNNNKMNEELNFDGAAKKNGKNEKNA
jgi:hypothetical protein